MRQVPAAHATKRPPTRRSFQTSKPVNASFVVDATSTACPVVRCPWYRSSRAGRRARTGRRRSDRRRARTGRRPRTRRRRPDRASCSGPAVVVDVVVPVVVRRRPRRRRGRGRRGARRSTRALRDVLRALRDPLGRAGLRDALTRLRDRLRAVTRLDDRLRRLRHRLARPRLRDGLATRLRHRLPGAGLLTMDCPVLGLTTSAWLTAWTGRQRQHCHAERQPAYVSFQHVHPPWSF